MFISTAGLIALFINYIMILGMLLSLLRNKNK